ncbi:MAG: hypothetical protein Q4D38_00180 [Planctomycetia bacterium]|nr:hypothetical protein [Planctomycetia bacterium]
MPYTAPGVRVYQQLSTNPTNTEAVLRSWIVGTAIIKHTLDSNRAVLGEYENNVRTYNYPSFTAGNVLDKDSVSVVAENATLRYAEIPAIASPTEDSSEQFVYNVPGTANVLFFNNINVATNGSHTRDAMFGTRDVQIGDTVRLQAYAANIAGATECSDVAFETTVADYVVTMTDDNIGYGIRTTNANNPTATFPSGSAISAAAGSTYTGNFAEDVYTVIVQDSQYKVISASGQDSYPSEFTSLATETAFQVGTCGIKAQLSTLDDAEYIIMIKSSAFAAANPERVMADLYDAATNLTITGTYNPMDYGELSAICTIRVTGKTNTAACKNIELAVTVGTNPATYVQAVRGEGTDWVFPITSNNFQGAFSNDDYDNIAIGDTWAYRLTGAYTPASLTTSGTYSGEVDDTYIIRCEQGGTVGDPSDAPVVSIISAMGEDYMENVSLASTSITTKYGLVLTFSENEMLPGQAYMVQVEASKNGAVHGLLLKDSLPQTLRSAASDALVSLNVELCVAQTVTVPDTFYTLNNEELTITTAPGVTVYNEAFGKSLTLLNGNLVVLYDELSAQGSGAINIVSSTDDLATIPGELSPDNPVKYGVYKALTMSNGADVAWTPVVGESLTAWTEALSAAKGDTNVYMVVPMSQDIDVLSAAIQAVDADSNEEECAWKRCFLSVACPDYVERVGQTTSTDGKPVMATFSGDGTVNITSRVDGKINVDLSSVQPGDSLVVFAGSDKAYTVTSVRGDVISIQETVAENATPQRIAIRHTLTKDEAVKYITDVAGTMRNRRVSLVWPDQVSEGTVTMPGTMLCAAIAGLASGVEPHQSLTNSVITGFDGFTRSSPMFSESQLKQLAANGVLVVRRNRDGSPVVLHGLTTEVDDLNYTEEMVTRNLDQISLELSSGLKQFIGVYNINANTIALVKNYVHDYCEKCIVATSASLGGRLNDYTIVSIDQDILLKDQLTIVLAVSVPYAMNVINLYIQV